MKSQNDNEGDELLWSYIRRRNGDEPNEPIAPTEIGDDRNMEDMRAVADAVRATLTSDATPVAAAAQARARLERAILADPGIERNGHVRKPDPQQRRTRTGIRSGSPALLIALLLLLAAILAFGYYNYWQSKDHCGAIPTGFDQLSTSANLSGEIDPSNPLT